MDYQSIIDEYYPSENELRRILMVHSRQVADRCLLIARKHPELRLDAEFLEEAAMLHDIGIGLTYYIIDVRKWGKWLSWLKIYGMNAITAYCIGEMLHYDTIPQAIGNALLVMAILIIMYRKKFFLKV